MKMRYLLACVASLFFTIPALGADVSTSNPPLTNGKALSLLQSLRSLDTGRWEFGNALLRLRIKRDIQALEPIEKTVEEVRLSTVRELTNNLGPNEDGTKPTRIEESPKSVLSFQNQMKELLEKPVDGPINLWRIRASELKLDKNEVPLAGLDPILDDDVSPK